MEGSRHLNADRLQHHIMMYALVSRQCPEGQRVNGRETTAFHTRYNLYETRVAPWMTSKPLVVMVYNIDRSTNALVNIHGDRKNKHAWVLHTSQ